MSGVVDPVPYRGRFAPSPTGPLHLGSLLTAVASYLDARAHAGAWLVRIEDIDPPREQPGAAERILATLTAHALESDEEVLYQSDRLPAHLELLARLVATGAAFRCTCSRTELDSTHGAHAAHCPARGGAGNGPAAVRVSTRELPRRTTDLLLGPSDWNGLDRSGSFVAGRRDGLIAYHLAVVADDDFQRISHVMRGRDLLDSTPYHLLLQQLLGLPSPGYGHLPLLLGADGQKLSKQNLAAPVEDACATDNLLFCLAALRQPLPPAAQCTDCSRILAWATEHWDRATIPDTDLAAPDR